MKEQLGKETPGLIAKEDRLGREERSQSDAKRSFRRLKREGEARAPVSRFKPPQNSNEISVNRMDLVSMATMVELGVRNASSSGKLFWGWYILTAGDIEEVGCSVKPSPSDDNPYHADIVIPVALDAEERRDEVIEYARDLAYHATFLPWGEWTKTV
ncbi:MAG: hypothetical protein OXF23_01425 [Candidatus Dadabacteria bacterium]|nr:hypothetical protein [Candidatus Dadabacteria bacterium]